MTFQFFHSIFDIRDAFHDQGLEGAKVKAAVHEAAHATVAIALGMRLTQLRVWNDGDGWEGEFTAFPGSASEDDRLTLYAAGAASFRWLDGTLKRQGADLWHGCEFDLRDMRAIDPDLSDYGCERYAEKADRILLARRTLFAAFVDAILEAGGSLDERAICELTGQPAPAAAAGASRQATPARTFDHGKARAFMLARGATPELCDMVIRGIEAIRRDGAPARQRTTSTPMAYQHRRRGAQRPSVGLRYSDPVGIETR